MILDRRTVLAATGAAVVAGLASGCELNNPYDTDPTTVEEAIDRLDPDVALAVEAVAAIGAAQRLAEATGRRHPTLNAPLAGLLSMHREHHAALVEAVPDDVDLGAPAQPPAVAARPAAAHRQLLQAEETLRGHLRGFALRAESGPFARLLASMAASVAQHTAVQGTVPL